MYDLIGDIHGYAAPLKALLKKLGYKQKGHSWSHPERKVIFLGDFVDRGPAQVEVYEIARAMVEAGHALSVMGNHEFNAVAWATEVRPGSKKYLRSHSEKNRHQHQDFLEQVVEGSKKHREIIKWFKTLPIYLDLAEFRVVHACWDPQSLEVLKLLIDHNNVLLPEAWVKVCTKNTEAFEAAEVVLKGLEIPLPHGKIFQDKDGVPRTNIRTRWWQQQSLTYRDLAMVSADVIPQIPHTPVERDILPGYDDVKPVFVGHYWLNGTPQPLTSHVVCLDYSIAAKGSHDRKLVAYRWDNVTALNKDNFVWVGSNDE